MGKSRAKDSCGVRSQVDAVWAGELQPGHAGIVRRAAGLTKDAWAAAGKAAASFAQQGRISIKPRGYQLEKRHITQDALLLVDQWFTETSVPSKDTKHVRYQHISKLPPELRAQALADHPEMQEFPQFHVPREERHSRSGAGSGFGTGKGSGTTLTRTQRGSDAGMSPTRNAVTHTKTQSTST